METSLLMTKLNTPLLRAHLIARPLLAARLAEISKYTLLLVSAPAGFGKTTLLSQWIRGSQTPIRAAWFSLDKGDNDPVRFWDYFISALRKLHPTCGERVLPLLHSLQPPAAELIKQAAGVEKGERRYFKAAMKSLGEAARRKKGGKFSRHHPGESVPEPPYGAGGRRARAGDRGPQVEGRLRFTRQY